VDTLVRDKSQALWLEYRRTRDVGIRNALVLEHMALVHHLAARYAPLSGEALDDVIQEGCLGLIQAVERFRPEYGLQFSTYAYPVISGTIKNYLRRRRRLLGQLRADADEAAGRDDPARRVGEELMEPLALEDISDEAAGDFADRVVDRLLTDSLLSRIPRLERLAVRQLFYEDLTQREIAAKVARSASRISRILRRALERIRDLLVDVGREESLLMGNSGSRIEVPATSFVDPETGLFSPSHLGRFLRREMERARELNAPLTLTVFRLHGANGEPSARDLSRAAARIYQRLRVLDHVFRAGPNELAVIFSLPAPAVDRVCERFRADRTELGLDYANASYPYDGDSPAKLLEAARRRLDASS
jgi:RNA polymerase sigma factor (sigma-70 family)